MARNLTDADIEHLIDLSTQVLDEYIIPKEQKLYLEDIKHSPFMIDCHIFIKILELQQLVRTGKIDKKKIQKELKYIRDEE